jgi:class 3 adenylate cyclase/tetratricopeptide (TPR) repeat protein
MRDVAEWLQALGLSKYADVFNKNEIDFEALPYLTESMLERLGLPIGPRAKVLAAISELASPRDAGRGVKTTQIGPVEWAARNQQAERRQITVVFCDIVDSSRLAGRLDPEDLGSVIRAYQRACEGIIERHGGNVARYFGDGIMAYFGWPVTHEDAAERAVRAGLEVVEVVKGVATPDPLSVRVGISTGIVLIGEMRAGNPAIPADAIGETPYLASRLQSIAMPNSVVIAEATSRLLSARFDLEELGPRNLKGVTEPVSVLRVRGVQDNSRRFRAIQGKPLTSLIGRGEELAFLNQRWRKAKSGEGQIVFVSGIPGIGKSRIVHELETSIEGEPYCTMHFQCLPHCMQSALFPIIQQIKSLGQLTTDDDGHATLDKIGKLISRATEQVDKTLPLIADMIGAPIESRYPPLALTAQQIKTQTLLALAQLLIGISARGPVFCVLEDAQWIDPSANELLDLVAGQIEKANVLLIVTHRPEWQSSSRIYGNASKLTLSRLNRDEAAELTHLVLRHQAVSPLLLERVVNESDAIPLFVEELARGVMVERGGSIRHAADDPNAESSASWSVPESLRDSLVARLDRAPQARSVAQMAAVVGREFTYNLLSRISPLIRLELDSALEHLEQSEIIQRVGSHPFDRYVFKHALLRDAAYESLLRANRRGIHAKVASAMEYERPEIVAAQPELLAYHYGLAGNAELAAQYWVLGGQRARSRSANLEAAGQFQRALEALESLPETLERKRTKLEIQLSLGLCFIAVRGYSSDETRRSFELAHSLCAELDEQNKELQAFFGLWGHYWMTARHDRAIELSETLLLKAESSREPVALIVGHRSLGCTLFTQGEFVRARGHLERAVVLAQQAAIDVSNLSYAVDPRIAAQLVLAWDLWILGYPGQALHLTLQALALSVERGEPYGVAFAHYVTSAVLLLRGEPKEALLHAEESFSVSREHRINLYESFSQFGRGCALGMMGQRERAISDIRQGIEAARRSDLRYMRSFMLGSLATVQADTGDPETAMSTLNEAFEHTNNVAGRAWEAELYRLRGDILLLGGSDAMEMAERSYRDAIGVARRQHAHSLELRATTSLARVLQGRHRNDEAFELLTPTYTWFVEGFDTVDLREAKVLLSELRPGGPFA